MSSSEHRPVIVVGYDGSPASEAALTLATERAGSNGRLYVVHAFTAPADYLGASYYEVILDAAAQHAKTLIAALSDDPRLAGVDWREEVMTGDPARCIADVARTREADEIIVGSRGSGRLRALLGSVSHELLHRADRPVTIIPERMVVGAADPGDATIAGAM